MGLNWHAVNNFGEFRWKSSFTLNPIHDLEKAISEDNYGAFRINASLAGITWHRVCDPHSVYYLYTIKSAGKILRALLGIGKEDRTEFNAAELLYNMFLQPNTAFEDIIRGFAKYPVLEYEERVEMLREAMDVTCFVSRTYCNEHNKKLSGASIDKIHDLFEELFPGKNLFPARFGTWTDERDGEVYGTVRIEDSEWIRMPLKYGMGPDGLISLEEFLAKENEIIPEGWHIPGCGDTISVRDHSYIPMDIPAEDRKLFDGTDRKTIAALLSKDSPWPLIKSDMNLVSGGQTPVRGSDKWNEQIGQSGLDFRPTYGTGDSRESTVMTIISKNNRGDTVRQYFSLEHNEYCPFDEPECARDPNRYDTKVYERCCVLLCRDVK
jgi:hypothetical protein